MPLQRLFLFVKQLFCHHEWDYISPELIDGGYKTFRISQCIKCGKIKII